VCWSTVNMDIAFAGKNIDVGAVAARVGGENRASVGRHVTGCGY
jgi:hypothetical protein